MKKLIVSIAFLACSGILLAQHTDVVYQAGSFNTSTVTQDTYFEDPVTPGYPSPVGNLATVDQIGDVNVSTVVQDNNGYAGGAEIADVDQIGSNNLAGIWQYNFGHYGKILSMGWYNDAFITQWGNLNDGYITQIGNENYGLIRTSGLQNISNIYQNGDWNESWQYMGGIGTGTEVNYNEFYANQIGISNWAYQELQGDDWAGGVEEIYNYGIINQTGNNNAAQQLIYFGFGDMHDNWLGVTQTGNENNSNQFIKGSSNTSTHTAIGNYNIENTYQNW